MTEPILLHRSIAVALVVLLQVILPPLVVAGTLVAMCSGYGVTFSGFFQVLAGTSAALTVLLPRGRPHDSSQLAPASLPLAVRVILRWLVIVAIDRKSVV